MVDRGELPRRHRTEFQEPNHYSPAVEGVPLYFEYGPDDLLAVAAEMVYIVGARQPLCASSADSQYRSAQTLPLSRMAA